MDTLHDTNQVPEVSTTISGEEPSQLNDSELFLQLAENLTQQIIIEAINQANERRAQSPDEPTNLPNSTTSFNGHRVVAPVTEWTEDKKGTLSHMIEQTTSIESKARGSSSSKKQRRKKGGVDCCNEDVFDREGTIVKGEPLARPTKKIGKIGSRALDYEDSQLAPKFRIDEHALSGLYDKTHADWLRMASESSENVRECSLSSCKPSKEFVEVAINALAQIPTSKCHFERDSLKSEHLDDYAETKGFEAERPVSSSSSSRSTHHNNPDLDIGIEKVIKQASLTEPKETLDTNSGDYSSSSSTSKTTIAQPESDGAKLNVNDADAGSEVSEQNLTTARVQEQKQDYFEAREQLNTTERVEHLANGDLNFGQTKRWGCEQDNYLIGTQGTKFKDANVGRAGKIGERQRDQQRKLAFSQREQNNSLEIGPIAEETRELGGSDLETLQSLASEQKQQQQKSSSSRQNVVDIESSVSSSENILYGPSSVTTSTALTTTQEPTYSERKQEFGLLDKTLFAAYHQHRPTAHLIDDSSASRRKSSTSTELQTQTSTASSSNINREDLDLGKSTLVEERLLIETLGTEAQRSIPEELQSEHHTYTHTQVSDEKSVLCESTSSEIFFDAKSSATSNPSRSHQQETTRPSSSHNQHRTISYGDEYFEVTNFADGGQRQLQQIDPFNRYRKLYKSTPTLDEINKSSHTTTTNNNNNNNNNNNINNSSSSKSEAGGDHSSSYTTAPLDHVSSTSNLDFTSISTCSQSVYATAKSNLTAGSENEQEPGQDLAQSTSTVNENNTSEMVSFSIEDRARPTSSLAHSSDAGSPTITPNTEELEDVDVLNGEEEEEGEEEDNVKLSPSAVALDHKVKLTAPGNSSQMHQQQETSNDMLVDDTDDTEDAPPIDADQLRRILTCKRLSEGCNRLVHSSFVTRKNSLHMIEELPPLTEGEAMKHMSYHLSQNIESIASSGSSGSLRVVGRAPSTLRDLAVKRGSQEENTSCSSSTSLERSPLRRRSSTVSQCSSILSEGARNQLNFDLSPDLAPDSSLLEANAISPTDMEDRRPASPEPSSLSGDAFDLRPGSQMSHDELMLTSPDSTLGDSNDNQMLAGQMKQLTQSYHDHQDIMELSCDHSEIHVLDSERALVKRTTPDSLERSITNVSIVIVSNKSSSKRAASDDLVNSQMSSFGQKSAKSSGNQEAASKSRSLLPRLTRASSGTTPASGSCSPEPSLRPQSAASSSHRTHSMANKSIGRSKTLNSPSSSPSPTFYEQPLNNNELITRSKHCSANSTCSSSSSSTASHSFSRQSSNQMRNSTKAKNIGSSSNNNNNDNNDKFRYLYMIEMERKDSHKHNHHHNNQQYLREGQALPVGPVLSTGCRRPINAANIKRLEPIGHRHASGQESGPLCYCHNF